MSKKLSKKFLSSIAASMMVLGAAPKSNAQTLKYSASYRNSSVNNNNNIDAKVLVVASVGLTAIAAIVIGGMILSSKAYEEKMQKRQDKIDNSCRYIQNLAQNLKTVLNDDLFDSLVMCNSDYDLRNWQFKVSTSSSLSVGDLDKVISNLHNHWRNCYILTRGANSLEVENLSNLEVQALRNKYHALVEKKRYEEHMRLLEERNRIERAKLNHMNNRFSYGVNRNISYEQNISYNYNFNNNY